MHLICCLFLWFISVCVLFSNSICFINPLLEMSCSHIGCSCLIFCQYVFSDVFSKSILEKKNNWTLVQFFSTVSFQIRRQLVSIRERIITLHWLHLYGFSPLCFLCASSNISLNRLSKRMQNHIYCICLIFNTVYYFMPCQITKLHCSH